MATYKTFGGQTYSLGASISSTDNTILLTSFTEPVSNVVYTMALLGTDIVYGTIAPGTTSSEFISFTGITANADGSATLTGVVRGLAKKTPYTTSATFKLPHSGQSTFIISNPPQLYEKFVSKVNDESIDGIKTFTSSPIVPTGGTGTQVANATDIANAVTGASGLATEAVYGTVKLSVAAVSASVPISVGDNDGRVPTQNENNALVGNNTDIAVGTGNKFVTQTGLQHNAEKYAADAGANDTYVITLSPVPTSYTAGMIVHFKANTVNTGAATLDVNSLGAKTIVSAVNTTLTSGDIAAGQFCTVIYDGTNFVLQNGVSKGYVDTQNTATQNLLAYSLFTLIASANSKTTDSASVSIIAYSSYTKVKEILLNDSSGVVRVSMNLNVNGNGSSSSSYGKVYVNGSAVGAEHVVTSSGSASNTFTDDITVTHGDLIQVYCKVVDNGGMTGSVSTVFVAYDKTTINTIANTVNI